MCILHESMHSAVLMDSYNCTVQCPQLHILWWTEFQHFNSYLSCSDIEYEIRLSEMVSADLWVLMDLLIDLDLLCGFLTEALKDKGTKNAPDDILHFKIFTH